MVILNVIPHETFRVILRAILPVYTSLPMLHWKKAAGRRRSASRGVLSYLPRLPQSGKKRCRLPRKLVNYATRMQGILSVSLLWLIEYALTQNSDGRRLKIMKVFKEKKAQP